MVELIGAGMALALLYFWLTGHWFARALVFVGLAGLLAFIGGGIVDFYAPPIALVGVGAGGIAAWFLSGVPVYRKHRAERIRLSHGETFVIPYPR